MLGGDLSAPLATVGSTLTTLSVQTVAVVVHELGHLLAARSFGVAVDSFNVGVGPAVLRWRKGPVDVAVRVFPFGGFVAFPPSYNLTQAGYVEFEDPALLGNRPVAQQAVVASAGVAANLILAWFCICDAALGGVPQPVYADGVRVVSVMDSATSVLQPGDVIMSIQGTGRVSLADQAVRAVIRDTRGRVNQPTTIELLRGDEPKTVVVTPTPKSGDVRQGTLGIRLTPNVVSVERRVPSDIGELVTATNREFFRIFGGTWNGLLSNVRPVVDPTAPPPDAALVGPVGLLKMGKELSSSDQTAAFLATLSIDLAIVNALPLPVLDGGKLVTLLVEAATRRKIPYAVRETIEVTAVLALIGFTAFITLQDLT